MRGEIVLFPILALHGCYAWTPGDLTGVAVTWNRTEATAFLEHGQAVLDKERKVCTINAPDNETLLGHELKHCLGWTH